MTSRNIVRHSTRSTLLDESLLSRDMVRFEERDLNVEPIFVDAESGDYRPVAESPVVDQGVAQEEYLWGWTDEFPRDDGYSSIQPEEDDIRQPVDGNGDGTAEFDIGAHEYTP